MKDSAFGLEATAPVEPPEFVVRLDVVPQPAAKISASRRLPDSAESMEVGSAVVDLAYDTDAAASRALHDL